MPRCRVGLPKPPAGPSLASTTIFRAAKQTRRTLATGPIMKSDGRLPVAIVGGGFSGTILAAQLARRGVSSVLIDGSGRMGRGVAYSTREPAHLLHVRAPGISALARQAGPFAQPMGHRFACRGYGARRNRRDRAASRNRPDDDRPRAVPRRGGPPRPDRGVVTAWADSPVACRFRTCSGRTGRRAPRKFARLVAL